MEFTPEQHSPPRERLARGRDEQGAWQVGRLLRSAAADATWIEVAGPGGEPSRVPVQPATVGLATPRQDAAGQPIFEGDIVSCRGRFCTYTFAVGPDRTGAYGLLFAMDLPLTVLGTVHEHRHLLLPAGEEDRWS